MKFHLREVALYERPVLHRIPFRFGAATVREVRNLMVLARIECADGRSAVGVASETMGPKWFDKDPKFSNEDNIEQLRRSVRLARAAYLGDGSAATAFEHSARAHDALMQTGRENGLNLLTAAFGPAEIDKAIADAVCRLQEATLAEALRGNLFGVTNALAPDLTNEQIAAFLGSCAPLDEIAVRHTVGFVDPLTATTLDPDQRIGDGLPESLDEIIARYGCTWFKVKLSGAIPQDIERLREIRQMLAGLPAFSVTLDGNEQFADLEQVDAFLSELRADPALGPLARAIRYLEQPLQRYAAFEGDVHRMQNPVPLIIDESDFAYESAIRARQAGYSGISYKSAKGMYKGLVNAVRASAWTADGTPFFLSAEDMGCIAGVSLQQDLAMAAALGLRNCERNGHHYIAGFSGASPEYQALFLRDHPDLYEVDPAGLRIAAGAASLRTVNGAVGFGVSSVPPTHGYSELTG